MQNFNVAISLGFMLHIPKEFFEQTLTLNVHPGKLPTFKGKDPHLQALKAGVEWTAVTIHKVVEELDSGEILVEVPVRINKNDTAISLEERLRFVAVYATASLLYGVSKGETLCETDVFA
jgi:folate-dependent phosphoribosylglycinamide formyltransferase PurN